MDRSLVVALAGCVLAWCGNGAASEVSRCVNAGGAVLIVDTPCPAGARTSWTRTLGPDTRSEDVLARIAREQRQRLEDAERLAFMAGTLPSHARQRPRATWGDAVLSACVTWRKRRETRLAEGRPVDYDTRRALNDRVFDACR